VRKEENEYLTRIGPGTPMGNLLRRFWMPILLEHEVPGPNQPPVRQTNDHVINVTHASKSENFDPLNQSLPDYYLPQALSQLLPRLLPTDQPKKYLFAVYVPEVRAVMHRYVDVGEEKRVNFGGQANIVYFMFFRVAAPIAVFLLALFYVFFLYDTGYPPLINFLIALGAGFLGFYLPNMFITNRVQKRQMAIKQAFPDALDMLLICVQSGMSVESGFAKVGKEIAGQSIELAEEMTLTTAELSYLQDRRQAYENLAKRTGLPGVKAVSTALIQAERYGTPVGQALRSMAKENREIRQSEAERKAAALPPKLTVPMIVFFLPVLFIVILGPAGISYMQLPP